MEPSWTFPIPQAMQQHRGSTGNKPAPKSNESIAPAADTAGEASPNEQYERPERRP